MSQANGQKQIKNTVWLLQTKVQNVWATQKVFSIELNARKALLDAEFHIKDFAHRIKPMDIEDNIMGA